MGHEQVLTPRATVDRAPADRSSPGDAHRQSERPVTDVEVFGGIVRFVVPGEPNSGALGLRSPA